MDRRAVAERQYYERLEDAIATEQRWNRAVVQMALDNAEAIRNLWHQGDGYGGAVHMVIARTLGLYDGRLYCEPSPRPAKRKINRTLSRKVMERDGYRCQSPGCGTHLDLTCDHVIPESKGGEATLENLQTLCRPCNSRKGAR